MKQITVKEWEDGYKLPNDIWEPIYTYSNFNIVRQIAGCDPEGYLVGFIGKLSGVKLHPEFDNVLERV